MTTKSAALAAPIMPDTRTDAVATLSSARFISPLPSGGSATPYANRHAKWWLIRNTPPRGAVIKLLNCAAHSTRERIHPNRIEIASARLAARVFSGELFLFPEYVRLDWFRAKPRAS
ncbi:MAG: hypothetical protein U1E81_20570 [Xanthobacteraceae bacterium]